MKIIVFGSCGMLGSTLVRKLIEAGYFPDTPTHRMVGVGDIPNLKDYDMVFNCLGAIPQKTPSFENMLFANTVVPRLMGRTATKLVHFSTDCVFSGLQNVTGKYEVNDSDWSNDDYGWTKRNGEVLDNPHVLNIRTSIIGHRGPKGLLDWFLYEKHSANHKGLQEVQGYTTHFWNGFTTNELSHILISNISKLTHLSGVIQLGGECVNKYHLLCKIKEAYNPPVQICPTNPMPIVDKCLCTTHFFADVNKPLSQQLKEMKEDEVRWGALA